LKTRSILLGVTGTCLFCYTLYSYIGSSNVLKGTHRNYRLRGTIDTKEEENSLSAIALFIWGLVMAKAKTGYAAA